MKLQARFYFSLIIIGIAAGLVGVALTFLLHSIQHITFNYGNDGTIHSFRAAVENTPTMQRWLALTLCGVIVAFGWYGLHKYGKPLVSIKKSLDNPQKGVPVLTTISHALLQIVTVALGSPLGREVAPREMSVAIASAWLKKVSLEKEDAKLLLACASGAGLTAVYNVPIAATLFIIETMILVFTPRHLISAFITVSIATIVARLFLGDLVQYGDLPKLSLDNNAIIAAPFLGLLIGFMVNLFQSSTKKFPFLPRTDKRIIPLALCAFSLIGAISIFQPEILGNGKAGNQLTFAAIITWQDSLQLMILKWIAVLLALAAGAYGGLITPSMMLGSTFAYTLTLLWNSAFPQFALQAEIMAIVGACAFLGISLKMPLTAIVFLLELTRSSAEMLMPLTLAMTAAIVVNKFVQIRKEKT